MDRRVVKRATLGRVPERDVINLQRGCEELIAALTDALKGAVLVFARDPMTAPAIDALEDDDEVFRAVNVRYPIYFLGNLLDAACLPYERTPRVAHRRPPLRPAGRTSVSVDRAQSGERALRLRSASVPL
jgi:hypothetical protein